ncbi:hypothetical protein LCGC14_0424660 [marine sediment metagenome]|uniref:LamG-like jellyroll fold domain-containing protein n=1 Tax=marine sediment metagenome TaxID=412755 RepID=A0A0F9SVY7_9ZZZZ
MIKRLLLTFALAFSGPSAANGARLFDDSVGDFLDAATAAVTAPPFTACGWFRSDDSTDTAQVIFAVGQAGTDNFWRVRARNAPLSIEFGVEQTMPAVDIKINTTNTWAQDVWACWCAVEAATDDHRIFLEGAGKSTSATDIAPKSVDTTEIGRSDDGSPGDNFSGDLGHIVMWDFALSDNEVATVCQPTIRMWNYRPADQIRYWGVNGQTVEPDSRGTVNLTVTGATVSEEPPIPHPIIAP